eukprot:scaffold87515_cov20-Prasinocladus_malaysianus.AAC.1
MSYSCNWQSIYPQSYSCFQAHPPPSRPPALSSSRLELSLLSSCRGSPGSSLEHGADVEQLLPRLTPAER